MQRVDISIHALLAESDRQNPGEHYVAFRFLSTLSLRRATLRWLSSRRKGRDFYPRSPCGERLYCGGCGGVMSGISIHALLAESDPLKRLRRKLPQISIHALLAESDGCTEAGRAGDIYFYPRSPCGERPISWKSPSGWNRISIHALLAESDAGTGCCLWHPPSISIHALLAESDLFHQVIQRRGVISIHALLAESDIVIPDAGISEMISIHALLAESDTSHRDP